LTWSRYLQLSQASSKCFTTWRQYENEFNSKRDRLHESHKCDVDWSRNRIKKSFMYEDRCVSNCVKIIRSRTNWTFCSDNIKTFRVCELWTYEINFWFATRRIEYDWLRFSINLFITTL
jgi:hypothetical protein